MKAQLFASAALVLLNAIPGALSAEPQLRGVILATDFEDQLDLNDPKDEDLSEDFEATEPYEEDDFDSSDFDKMEPYEEDFYGWHSHGHQGMPGGMSGYGHGQRYGYGGPYGPEHATPHPNGIPGMSGGMTGYGHGQRYGYGGPYGPEHATPHSNGIPGMSGGMTGYGHGQRYGYGGPYGPEHATPHSGSGYYGGHASSSYGVPSSGGSVDGDCSSYPAEACGSGGGGRCTWTDQGCVSISKSGGSGGKRKGNRGRDKKGEGCKAHGVPSYSVCYRLCETTCDETDVCTWSRAAGGYCDGGY